MSLLYEPKQLLLSLPNADVTVDDIERDQSDLFGRSVLICVKITYHDQEIKSGYIWAHPNEIEQHLAGMRERGV